MPLSGMRMLRPDEAGYPHLLHQIQDPPRTLYVRGDVSCLAAPCLAVVGTRRMTPYGKTVLAEFIPPLVAAGVTVVSGLALGIDAEAHRLTLLAGGKTAAVLGSGITDAGISPSCHLRLAREILAHGGAILSEYPEGSPPLKFHFPVRNRILSGACLGTLVIEAALKSGSLITARHAADQGREVFAVPGDILRETSGGPNRLIADGARPALAAADVLDVLGIQSQASDRNAPPALAVTGPAAALLAHLSREPVHLDQLVRASKLPAARVAETLLLMELRGQVRHLGNHLYRL